MQSGKTRKSDCSHGECALKGPVERSSTEGPFTVEYSNSSFEHRDVEVDAYSNIPFERSNELGLSTQPLLVEYGIIHGSLYSNMCFERSNEIF